jgi:hypothetical protein
MSRYRAKLEHFPRLGIGQRLQPQAFPFAQYGVRNARNAAITTTTMSGFNKRKAAPPVTHDGRRSFFVNKADSHLF